MVKTVCCDENASGFNEAENIFTVFVDSYWFVRSHSTCSYYLLCYYTKGANIACDLISIIFLSNNITCYPMEYELRSIEGYVLIGITLHLLAIGHISQSTGCY